MKKDEIDSLILRTEAVLSDLKEMRDSLDKETYVFIRCKTRRSGFKDWTTWKILLDETKSKYAVRDKSGFKSVEKRQDTQKVSAPEGIKDLLLAPNGADRIVATTTLNELAKGKYGAENC